MSKPLRLYHTTVRRIDIKNMRFFPMWDEILKDISSNKNVLDMLLEDVDIFFTMTEKDFFKWKLFNPQYFEQDFFSHTIEEINIDQRFLKKIYTVSFKSVERMKVSYMGISGDLRQRVRQEIFELMGIIKRDDLFEIEKDFKSVKYFLKLNEGEYRMFMNKYEHYDIAKFIEVEVEFFEDRACK